MVTKRDKMAKPEGDPAGDAAPSNVLVATHQVINVGPLRLFTTQSDTDDVYLHLNGAKLDDAVAHEPRQREFRSFRHFASWTDWLPSAGLRKQVRKMLADQQTHVVGLASRGKIRAARWQVGCTFALMVWLVLARPLSAASKVLRGREGR